MLADEWCFQIEESAGEFECVNAGNFLTQKAGQN